jgi:hypothetical protein
LRGYHLYPRSPSKPPGRIRSPRDLRHRQRPARPVHPTVPVGHPAAVLSVPRVYVYFDKLLKEGPLIESWWFLRTNSWTRILTNAVAIDNYVRIDTAPNYLDLGANRVRYDPVYPDLRDIDDLLIAPFVLQVTIT